MLPDIDISISDPPEIFLREISSLARISNRFDVEEHFNALGEPGFHAVNLHYRGVTPHVGVGGQLISRADTPRRISIEIRAERWEPAVPSREIYFESALVMIRPLLSTYNRKFGRRLRMRIEKPREPALEVTTRTKQLLDRFSFLANKASIHPKDWQRFYEFVALSRQKIAAPMLRAYFVLSGFTPQKSDYLADIYEHLWRFKGTK